MRKLPIFLALLVILAASASAESGWYPLKINTGTELQTDVGSARNAEALVAIQTIPAAESGDDDQIKAAKVNEFNATTKFVLTIANGNFLAQPDVPRNIIVTMNATATVAMMINGTDISGAAISENLTWAAESGAKASTKAFKTVTRIDATSSVTTVQGKIGTGDLLGLNTKLAFDDPVLFTLVNGAKEGTAPAVTTSSTVLSLNTIDTNSAPGGYVTKVYYLVTA
jgi:hypothetical protein